MFFFKDSKSTNFWIKKAFCLEWFELIWTLNSLIICIRPTRPGENFTRREFGKHQQWSRLSVSVSQRKHCIGTTEADLERAKIFQDHIDALLIDAWDPNALGGTGKRLPLKWIQRAKFKRPYWIAGGICAEWMPELFAQLTPFGVDASSKLELSPGIKDLRKVEKLIESIKKYE